MFKDKKILITGGTGSVGKRMLTYFIESTNIEEIRIFSRNKEKQDRMRTTYKDPRIEYYIGDVRDFESVNSALCEVDMVFHTASLKQVTTCELYPMEAVTTNILGSNNVLNAAVQNKVRNIVMLSTDKAVNPIDAMGMTKALMEKIAIAKMKDAIDTTVSITRYGNVMASRGSVIPLFIKQCKENVPITVTNPDMTRFLMSLDESVDLVLYALKNAQNGDIFVQKTPASTIYNLAIAIHRIFNAKNKIEIIGTRHGEKIHDTLVNREELAKAQDLGNFYRIPAEIHAWNYDNHFRNENMHKIEEYNSANTKRLTVDEVIEKLLSLDYVQTELKTKEYVGVAE